jgi:hypothetical protein
MLTEAETMKLQNRITITHAIIAVAFFVLGEICAYLAFEHAIHQMCSPTDGTQKIVCVLDSKP